MKTVQLEEIVSWFKSTDLTEVAYREGEDGFSLSKTENRAAAPIANLPNRYLAVASPAVGLFSFSEPGRARGADEVLRRKYGPYTRMT